MAELVVEAAGEPFSINLAAHLVKQYVSLLYFRIPRAPTIPNDFPVCSSKYYRPISISGASSEPELASTKQALNMITYGKIYVEPLITHIFPFADKISAYNMAHKRCDSQKVHIQLIGGLS